MSSNVKGLGRFFVGLVLALGANAVIAESPDDLVIEELRASGSDLSKPHAIDFYIYVPSEAAARRVSLALVPDGFSVRTSPAALGAGWLALASKTLLPTTSAMAAVRKRLESVATSEGGEYDGWEAPVVR